MDYTCTLEGSFPFLFLLASDIAFSFITPYWAGMLYWGMRMLARPLRRVCEVGLKGVRAKTADAAGRVHQGSVLPSRLASPGHGSLLSRAFGHQTHCLHKLYCNPNDCELCSVCGEDRKGLADAHRYWAGRDW